MADASGLPSSTWGCLPPGWIGFFAADAAPNGFLICNGSTASRITYTRLFAAIGTRYGAGDGATTFGIPDLRDKTVWGSVIVGQYLNAGLPNITGNITNFMKGLYYADGAIVQEMEQTENIGAVLKEYGSPQNPYKMFRLDASRSNSIYGSSNTVQPPALTLLPCIKY